MFIKNNHVQHSCTHIKNEKGSLSLFKVKIIILVCILLLPFQIICTPPEDEHSPAVAEQSVQEISDGFKQFRATLEQQPTSAVQDNSSDKAQETKKKHAKNHRNFKILAFTTSVLGCVGWMYQLDPVNTVSRAHHQTRTFGVLEGATALATIAPPLLTAGAAWLIWYKFNNLLHYPCKIERERDMESVSAQMTKTKTDMTNAFDTFTKQTEGSLAQMRRQVEKKAQEEREWADKKYNSMQAYMTAAVARSEKKQEESINQLEAQKKVIEKTFDTFKTSATEMHSELENTMKTNQDLKAVVSKAIAMLGKIGTEVGALRAQTTQEIDAISAKNKPAHKRKTSFLHFLHKAHGEPVIKQKQLDALSPRSQKKKDESSELKSDK